MSYLKRYPTQADVRALMDDDTIEARVLELSSYTKTVTIASLSGDISPAVVRAWIDLYEAVKASLPDAELTRDWEIKRTKTHDELVEAVLDDERSKRYYHPEKYAEYTSEDLADN